MQNDTDNDDVGDVCDNCIKLNNTNQTDVDGDGVGNACDNCRYYANKDQDPEDPERFGSLCTTKPAFEDDDEDMFTDRKASLGAKFILQPFMDVLNSFTGMIFGYEWF